MTFTIPKTMPPGLPGRNTILFYLITKAMKKAITILQEKVTKAAFYLNMDEIAVIVAAMEEYAEQQKNHNSQNTNNSEIEAYAAFCIELDKQGFKQISFKKYLEIG